MSGDVHVQFSERLRVKIPWSTQPYIKVKGQWVCLYRAVDFILSEKRHEPAARAFFEKAIPVAFLIKSLWIKVVLTKRVSILHPAAKS
jgi:hypothetical protein